jgi:hypothetical protein
VNIENANISIPEKRSIEEVVVESRYTKRRRAKEQVLNIKVGRIIVCNAGKSYY